MHSFKHKLLIKSASWFAVISSITILIIKFYSWLISDSQAILASLVDSMLDISSSLLNLIVINIALKPPDHQHRFGHEKFQDLAIFSQSIFFAASGLFTMISSARAIYGISKIHEVSSISYNMYICTVITVVLVIYQHIVVQKTKSKIIAVDRLHYFSDLLTNVAVIFSIYLSQKFWFIDPLLGIGISIYIIYNSYKLLKISVSNLVDEELSDKDKKKIFAIIAKHEIVQGVHEFKTRLAGDKAFIQFHLEVDGSMSLFDAHSIADKICDEIMATFPGCEVTIHQDPAGIEENVNYREKIDNNRKQK